MRKSDRFTNDLCCALHQSELSTGTLLEAGSFDPVAAVACQAARLLAHAVPAMQQGEATDDPGEGPGVHGMSDQGLIAAAISDDWLDVLLRG